MDFGLLVLRLVVGLALAAHGAQKLFGWFGGHGIAGTGTFMEQHLGFRPGRRAALMAGLAETGGGVLLALGLATPLAATMIVGVMVVAIFSVHLAKGFFAANGGYEYPLVLGLAASTLAFTGPGRFSADSLLALNDYGIAWGFGALAAGTLGAAQQLATRHREPAVHGEPKTA